MVTRPARPDELIELAAVLRAHGLRGELLLKPFNPESNLLTKLSDVQLRLPDGSLKPYHVRRTHIHGVTVLLGLDGVNDRDAAEALKGSQVCVPRSSLPDLDEDEHYLVDLVGLEARDGEGNKLGTIAEVIEYPSVCCLVVESAEGRVEVPDTDRYLQSIDAEAGFVTVAHLDELDILRTPAGKG